MNETKKRWETWLNVINTVVLGCLIPWGVWVTNQIYESMHFRQAGPRFTAADAAILKADVKEWHNADVDRVTKDIRVQLQSLHEGQLELKFMLKQHLEQTGKP